MYDPAWAYSYTITHHPEIESTDDADDWAGQDCCDLMARMILDHPSLFWQAFQMDSESETTKWNWG